MTLFYLIRFYIIRMHWWSYPEMEMQELGSHDESEIEHERNAKNMFCSLIKDFCDYTSAHGLGRIMAATHWVRKVLWIMLLLVAMTIMTIQVNVLYQKYQSRPLTTLVTVETASVYHFQSIYEIFNIVSLNVRMGPQRDTGTESLKLYQACTKYDKIRATMVPRSEDQKSKHRQHPQCYIFHFIS